MREGDGCVIYRFRINLDKYVVDTNYIEASLFN